MNAANVRNYPRIEPLLEVGSMPHSADTAGELVGPRIHMDPGLGVNYSFIDIDEAALRHRMQQEGLSDAQIAEHTVHVSSQEEDGYGAYRSTKKQIDLYPACSYEDHNPVLQKGMSTDEAQSVASKKISAEISKVIYHELRHVRQYVVEGTGRQRYASYEGSLARRYKLAATLGAAVSVLAGGIVEVVNSKSPETHVLAVATAAVGAAGSVAATAIVSKLRAYSDYANNPTEVEARGAEADAPTSLFTATVRTNTAAITKTYGFVDTRGLLLEKGDELVRSKLHPELWGDFLRVYADVSLGKHISQLDIDTETIVQRLQSESISADTVRNLAIHFTANDTIDLGEYMVDDTTIDVHALGTLIQCMYRAVNDAKSNNVFVWESSEADAYASKTMSETVYHEIRHVAQYERGDDIATANRKYNRTIVRKRALRILLGTVASIGASTLLQKHFGSSLHNHVAVGVGGAVAGIINTIPTKSQKATNYYNRPIEIEARSAEADAPSDLVRVELDVALITGIMQEFGTKTV